MQNVVACNRIQHLDSATLVKKGSRIKFGMTVVAGSG